MNIKKYMMICAIMAALAGQSDMVMAQSFTPDGAESVGLEIDEWLDFQMELMQQARVDVENEPETALVAAYPIVFEGKTDVTAEDGYYAARLPYMVLNMTGGRRLDVGRIAMNVVPLMEEENLWLVTLAVPPAMDVYSESGEKTGVVKIGQQKFKGIMDVAREVFVKYEGDYQNISADGFNGLFSGFSIAELGMSQDLNPVKTGSELYSGPIHFNARDLVFKVPSEYETEITIGRVSGKTIYEQMPLFDARGFQEDILNYADNTAEDRKNVTSSAFKIMHLIPENTQSQIVMNDFAVSGQDLLGATAMKVQKLTLDSYGRNMKGNQASTGVNYEIIGLSFEGMPDAYAPYLPTESRFDVDITNLPVESLIDAFEKQILEDNPASPLALISSIFAAHGTNIKITDTNTLAPEFALMMEGDLTASAVSPKMLIGDFTLRVKGLDQAVEALRQTMERNEESRVLLQQLVIGLAIAQTAGQLDATGDMRTYRFELKEDGQVLLNGANIAGLLGSTAH